MKPGCAVAAVALACIPGLSCAAHRGARGPGTVALDDTLCGGVARLRPGTLVRLRLPLSGATGHVWRVEAFPPDRLRALDGAAADVSTGDGPLGRAQDMVFAYRAERTGSAVLLARLARPWETGAARTCRIRLVVE